ncbi:MAG TPA: GyrI-like domain-containing protein [Streptosporangiaceae bacterium]|jgi:effector-binding domain-containing protein
MTNEPQIIERPPTPYVAITTAATMQNIGAVVPPLGGEVRDWLAARGLTPAGAPFWKYNVIDMEREMQIAAGFAIPESVDGDERVQSAVLPGGRYAVLWHVGHPRTLIDATARLLKWADAQGLTWDVRPTPDGDRWGSRLEFYHDEPGQDMNDWATELAFRLAD